MISRGSKIVQKRSFLYRTIFKQYRELIAPISTEGIEVKEVRSKGHNGHVSAIEFGQGAARPEVFTPSTLILNSGYGVWEISIPKDIRSAIVDANLRIETVRTHGMLHTPDKGKSASLYINDQLVDKIYLVKPHPHGEDFGVDSRRPFPIFRYLDTQKDVQTLRIEVDEKVCWDIDRLSIEAVVLRKEIKPGVAMILGALISAALGAFVTIVAQCIPGKGP